MLETNKEVYEWAVQTHLKAGKRYSKFDYCLHLDGVLAACRRYRGLYFNHIDSDRVTRACACHDVLEDCGISYNELKNMIGEDVANDVYDVSNEMGKTRKERNSKTYPKIQGNDYALFVKLCDRIANMLFSFYSYETNGMFETYCREYPEFKKSLKNDKYQEMWLELDTIYSNLMKSKSV